MEYLPPSLLPDLYNYHIFEIPPSYINRQFGSDACDRAGQVTATKAIAKATRTQFLLSGDWDLCYYQLDILDVVEEYCGRELQMESTRRYHLFMSLMEQGRYDLARDCRTQDDLIRYFRRIRKLHKGIRDKGYRRSSWIKGETGPEVETAVGRDGGLYILRNGNHRLAIAKLLHLPGIPVHVRAVHPYFLTNGRRNFQDMTPEAINERLEKHMCSMTSERA